MSEHHEGWRDAGASPPPERLPVELDPADEQDYRRGRENTIVDTLVLHTTEGGSLEGATKWWDREDVTASAHYLLDGKRIVARVAEGDTAFHAGSRAMNRRSVGIEVVGRCNRPEMWTPAVMEHLVALSAEIVQRHSIPILRQPGPGICGHCDVPNPKDPSRRGGASGHTDPGPHFPWDRYFAALRARISGGAA